MYITVLEDEPKPAQHITPPGFRLSLNFVDTAITKHHGKIERHIPQNGIAIVAVSSPRQLTQEDS